MGFRASNRSGGQAVAFLETLRNKRHRIGTERTQTARKHRSRRNAVKVEVAEHQDAPTLANGRLKAIGRLAHIGNLVRISPITLKVGREKRTGLVDACDAVSRHRARHKARKPEFLLKR